MGRVTPRGAALFALMSVLWGIPYFLIKVAVRHLDPAVLVEGRTLIGAAMILPFACRGDQLRPVLAVWKPFTVYCVCELAIPWFLLSDAERHLPSSLSGLLVATVPLIATVLATLAGRKAVVDRRGAAGILVGLAGVAVLLGLDVHGAQFGAVAQVLVVALGYAIGPLVATQYLAGLSSLALAAASLAAVAVVYLPFAVVRLPSHLPPAGAISAVVVLGTLCTAVAFVAFFELLREMPPTQATIITYFNPVVAVALGVAVLGEPFRWSTGAGFGLILVGSWFATGRSRDRETERSAR